MTIYYPIEKKKQIQPTAQKQRMSALPCNHPCASIPCFSYSPPASWI